MDFFEGARDDTFEVMEDFVVECILDGEQYTISKDSLHCTIINHYAQKPLGWMREHYFHADRFKCRDCGEELFVRVKAYEYPEGHIDHLVYEDLDVDFLKEPIIKPISSAVVQPQVIMHRSSFITEHDHFEVRLVDGDGFILGKDKLSQILDLGNRLPVLRSQLFNGDMLEILVEETGLISFDRNKAVFRELILRQPPHDYVMRLLGKVAEAVIVQRCHRDPEINQRWFRIARRKNTPINQASNYRAIGTGLATTKRLIPRRYNPFDTQNDIVWIDDQERYALTSGSTSLTGTYAGLQSKVSGDGLKYVWEDICSSRYEVPMVYFGINGDFDKIAERIVSDHICKTDGSPVIPDVDFVDASRVDSEAHYEVQEYYGILMRLITGEMTADELIRMCASNAVLKNGIAADSIAKTGSRILLL